MNKPVNGWDIMFVLCACSLWFYLMNRRMDDVDDALLRIEQRLAECGSIEQRLAECESGE